MKYLNLLLLMLLITPAFAQSKIAYLTADNKFTSSKDSAVVYLKIDKVAKDSLYSMSQYTIRDSLLLSGTFKDSTLTIPQGKFLYYYTPTEIHIWKMSHITGADTNKYMKTTGFYSNGKKTGVWNTYNYNGNLQNSVTYQDDILSGPFTFIDNGPTGISAHTYNGMYVDGKKEGESKVTSRYGRLEETQYFHDDQLAKTVVNHKASKGIIQPAAPFKLKAALNKKLTPYLKDGAGGKVVIKIMVDKNGTVTNPEITEGNTNMAKNQAIIDLLKNSGKWKAGTVDSHPADMVTFCTIIWGNSGFSYIVPKY